MSRRAKTSEEALAAWQRCETTAGHCEGVDVLKEGRSTAVYRLRGTGPGGSAVIAKRCRAAVAAVECAVYESILPRLPLPSLAYYGSVAAEDDRSRWLFTADAGDQRYSTARPAHRALASEWLAQLHVGGQRAAAVARLPDRGPNYFLGHLRSAYAALFRHLDDPAFSRQDKAVLRSLVAQSERLESWWGQVQYICGRGPTTLNHGDFAGRNIRVGPDHGLRVFDWQDAGWGPPTLDLIQSSPRALCDSASPDLELYTSIVRHEWPQMNEALLRQLAALGRVFWYVVAIRLDADSLGSSGTQRIMRNMRSYRAGLAHAVCAAGLAKLGEP